MHTRILFHINTTTYHQLANDNVFLILRTSRAFRSRTTVYACRFYSMESFHRFLRAFCNYFFIRISFYMLLSPWSCRNTYDCLTWTKAKERKISQDVLDKLRWQFKWKGKNRSREKWRTSGIGTNISLLQNVLELKPNTFMCFCCLFFLHFAHTQIRSITFWSVFWAAVIMHMVAKAASAAISIPTIKQIQ